MPPIERSSVQANHERPMKEMLLNVKDQSKSLLGNNPADWNSGSGSSISTIAVN